jgi:hypothetical protein
MHGSPQQELSFCASMADDFAVILSPCSAPQHHHVQTMPYGSEDSSDYDEDGDDEERRGMEDHGRMRRSGQDPVTNGPTDYEHRYSGKMQRFGLHGHVGEIAVCARIHAEIK